MGVTGKVGTGKSSFLSSIMADMRKKRGQVSDHYYTAYRICGIFHETIISTLKILR